MQDQTSFYAALPRKRMGAGALFHDNAKNILIVNPTYIDYWLFPGGTVEADESPAQGCLREITEEIGLAIPLERLLCVEHLAATPVKNESLQFLFYGGILTPTHIAAITLQAQELSEYRFVSLEDALTLLSPNLARRLPASLQALVDNRTVYLENGLPLYY